MYQDYFSLERHPFRITPDTSLFFSGGDQGRGVVLEALLFAIESGEGIIKVVGEVGSGKTMLCRMLEERLPESTEIVYLANPRLSPDEILYAVAFELKLPVRRDTSKLLVMQQLQTYLIKQHTANRKVLVIIEEAQGMPVETLEEIRLFSNLETQVDKLMQIVLFGQPELDKNLSSKNIRQLRERITHSFHLNPLTTGEVSEYVRFRLGAAGCPCPQLLSGPAEWLLSRASGGLTRRINILVDKALLAAYADDVLGARELDKDTPPLVTVRHIWAAICDSDYLSSSLHALFSPLRVASAGMLVAVLAMAVVLWPEAGSVAGPTQFIEQLSGKFSQRVAVLAPEMRGVAREKDSPAQKPAPLPLEQRVSPMDSTSSEARDTSPEPRPSQAAAPDEELPVAVPSPRHALGQAEGFAQPGWLAKLATDPERHSSVPQEEISVVAATPGRLQSRLLASIDWLRETRGVGYTIQFLSGESSDLEFAESFLRVLDQHGLIGDSYVCMSNDGSRSYWTVKYGNFEGLSLAQEFIDKLPPRIHGYGPFVQNMSSVECNTNPGIAALILE